MRVQLLFPAFAECTLRAATAMVDCRNLYRSGRHSLRNLPCPRCTANRASCARIPLCVSRLICVGLDGSLVAPRSRSGSRHGSDLFRSECGAAGRICGRVPNHADWGSTQSQQLRRYRQRVNSKCIYANLYDTTAERSATRTGFGSTVSVHARELFDAPKQLVHWHAQRGRHLGLRSQLEVEEALDEVAVDKVE
jgi:hypothetical protein